MKTAHTDPAFPPLRSTMLDMSMSSSLADEAICIRYKEGECLVSTWIIDTRETLIREALVKLGWTPPRPCPPIPASSTPA